MAHNGALRVTGPLWALEALGALWGWLLQGLYKLYFEDLVRSLKGLLTTISVRRSSKRRALSPRYRSSKRGGSGDRRRGGRHCGPRMDFIPSTIQVTIWFIFIFLYFLCFLKLADFRLQLHINIDIGTDFTFRISKGSYRAWCRHCSSQSVLKRRV